MKSDTQSVVTKTVFDEKEKEEIEYNKKISYLKSNKKIYFLIKKN